MTARLRPAAIAALLALTAALALAAAGCGGGGGTTGGATSAPSGSSAPQQMTTVKVGTLPIAALAPLYLGIEKGFFTAQKLHVEPQVAATGPAIVASVASGERQFGFTSLVALLQAAAKGLPIKMVAQGSQAGPGKSRRFEAVIASKKSAITSPQDLAGKTIGVNSLQSIGPLGITAALDKLGVDTSKVKYAEVPFPEVNAALAAGRVDAAYQTEPFLTQALTSGDFRVVTYHYEHVAPVLTIAGYFTTSKFIEQDGDVVTRFQKAMNTSLDYASKHPAEARAIVPTFTKIPPKLAKTMVLNGWSTNLDVDTSGIALTADLMVKQGFLPKRPDVDAIVVPDASAR